jgi:hypothetical protein
MGVQSQMHLPAQSRVQSNVQSQSQSGMRRTFRLAVIEEAALEQDQAN